MDLKLLSRFLQELILEYDRVSLPDMGSFVVEVTVAYFSEDGTTIFPPNHRISFKASETSDDGLILSLYQKEKGLEEGVAKEELSAFFKQLKKDLKQKRNIELEGFGNLRSTKEGNYFFVADRKLGIFAKDMGMEPISIKVLNQNPVEEVSVDISDEVSAILAGGDVAKVDEYTPEVVETQPQNETEKSPEKRKRGVWTIVGISVAAVVVLISILCVVFWSDISAMLENMMYSEEELELLRSNGLL